MPISADLKNKLLNDTEVDASKQGLRNEDMAELQELISKNPRIISLNLSDNKINKWDQAPKILGHPTLTDINLDFNSAKVTSRVRRKKETGSIQKTYASWEGGKYGQEVYRTRLEPVYTEYWEDEVKYVELPVDTKTYYYHAMENKKKLAKLAKELEKKFEDIRGAAANNSPDLKVFLCEAHEIDSQMTEVEKLNSNYYRHHTEIRGQLKVIQLIVADTVNIHSEDLLRVVTYILKHPNVANFIDPFTSRVLQNELRFTDLSDENFTQLLEIFRLFQTGTGPVSICFKSGAPTKQQLDAIARATTDRAAVEIRFNEGTLTRDNSASVGQFAPKLVNLWIFKTRFYPSMFAALLKTVNNADQLKVLKFTECNFSDNSDSDMNALAVAIASRKKLETIEVCAQDLSVMLGAFVQARATELTSLKLFSPRNPSPSVDAGDLFGQLLGNNSRLSSFTVMTPSATVLRVQNYEAVKQQLIENTSLKICNIVFSIPEQTNILLKILERNNNEKMLSLQQTLITAVVENFEVIKNQITAHIKQETASNHNFDGLFRNLLEMAKKLDSPDYLLIKGRLAVRRECQSLFHLSLQTLLQTKMLHENIDFKTVIELMNYAANHYSKEEVKPYWRRLYQYYIDSLAHRNFSNKDEHYAFLKMMGLQWLDFVEMIRADQDLLATTKQDLLRPYYNFLARFGWLDNEDDRLSAFRLNAIEDLAATKQPQDIELAIVYIRSLVYYTNLNKLTRHHDQKLFTVLKTSATEFRNQLINPTSDAQALSGVIDKIIDENTPLFGQAPQFVHDLHDLAKKLTKLRSALPAPTAWTNSNEKIPMNDDLEDFYLVPAKSVESDRAVVSAETEQMLAVSAQHPPSFSVDDSEAPAPAAAKFPKLVLPNSNPIFNQIGVAPILKPAAKAPATIAPQAVYFPAVPVHEPGGSDVPVVSNTTQPRQMLRQ